MTTAPQCLANGGATCASLHFVVAGGRTALGRQRVPYPFHITRPFYIDPDLPDLATLYIQSAAGGLFRDDNLSLDIAFGPQTRAHVTSQAATIVHRTDDKPARQSTVIKVGTGTFAAYVPDPLVLFSGASINTSTLVLAAPNSRAIVVDGFCWHDPRASELPFGRLKQKFELLDINGRRLVYERGELSGKAATAPSSPLGSKKAVGSIYIIGDTRHIPSNIELQQTGEIAGCICGATAMPSDSGRMLRCLADGGSELRRSLEAVFSLVFTRWNGCKPARRRK